MAVQIVKKKLKTGSTTKVKQEKQLKFIWEGVDRKGAKIKGVSNGTSPALVKAQLRKQGINPTSVKKHSKGMKSKGKGIETKDISLIARQLATMMKAGVPLVQSLDIIGTGNEKASVQDLVLEIKNDVEAGSPFGDSLRKHSRYFDDLFCDLVSAGEQAGALEEMLERIALYKEKSEALKSKIKSAMKYPITVLSLAGIVTAVLLIKVVPVFQDLFNGFGASLPAFTMVVIHLSDFMVAYWWIFVAVIIGLFVANREFDVRSEAYRDFKDRLILKIPIISEILNKGAVARFARTLSTTFAAGVPLVDALESAAGASGNVVYRKAILKIKDDVSTGIQLHTCMESAQIFPNMVNQMVAIGEESGALDSMLSKIADIYEAEVDDAVEGLSSLMEPLIMAVLGIVIGGLVIAMYLPIFKLGSVV